MKANDLTGLKIGRLTVTGFAGIRMGASRARRYWACTCECGNAVEIQATSLATGITQSCGCLHKESTAGINYKHGEARRTKENRAWYAMKTRCYAPNNAKYPQYGGRGITVCQRWLDSYEDFLLDMGRAPTPQHSIDRIDVDGNYELSNCRWATNAEQANNKTTNVLLELGTEKLNMRQWANKLGYNYKQLHGLLRYKGKTLAELAAAKGYKPTSTDG